MLWGSKLAVTLTNPYLHVPHPPFSPYLLPCAWTKKKRWAKAGEDEKRKKGNRKKYQSPEGASLPSFFPWDSIFKECCKTVRE
jgi:hypothetical protein